MASHMLRSTLRARLLSTARPKLAYIPQKTKEEILALHEEDAVRWNASTLATRFGAARENVEALLRLGALRMKREASLSALPTDERERLIKARDRATQAWSSLAEIAPGGYGRHPARPSTLETPAAPVGEDGADEAAAGDASEGEPVEEAEEVRNSAWADYLEREIGSMKSDVERRTTFAFIEVGNQKEEVRRAVWIREGSGALRLADEGERRLLLNEERSRDSMAWRS